MLQNESGIKRKVESFISSNIEKGYYSGGQVLVSYKGEILVDLSSGYMDRGSKDSTKKVTSDTIFNIESITKTMVTLPLTFKLVQDGNLNIEDKVVDFIPEFGTNKDKKMITIRDMLNFTGGIPLEDPAGIEEAAFEGNQKKHGIFITL